MATQNPVEWGLGRLSGAGAAVGSLARSLNEHDRRPLQAAGRINHIGVSDLRAALADGWQDFLANRMDVMMLCILYPALGLIFSRAASGHNLLPMFFPAASGFALVGPLAALGLYEMSRQREQGLPVTWATPLEVLRAPSVGPILLLGAVLCGMLLVWLTAARVIYDMTLGPDAPDSIGGFVHDVLTTQSGWAMIVMGMGVGFLFAAVVLAIATVSFPLMLDRHVRLDEAVGLSVRAVTENWRTMAVWGLIVAVLLALGSIPVFLGLVIVLPVLGHATWHLYRRLIPT